MRRLLAAAIALVLYVGAVACDSDAEPPPPTETSAAAQPHDEDSSPPPDKTPHSRADYELLLSALAENGWVITEDDRMIGRADYVLSMVHGCYISLTLVSARPLEYRAKSVNGYALDDFGIGKEVEIKLGQSNMTRDDFATRLAALQQAGVIETC